MQIHWAAKRGDNFAVERQLRRGVDVNAMDVEGKTPLMCAAEGQRAGLATLELLVERGANVNAVSGTPQDTPLGLAARNGRPEMVRFLLSAGADPRFMNQSGYTAITNVPAWRDTGHLAVLKILLEAGADADVVSDYGECPLRVALRAGNTPALRLLLKYGADRDPGKMTELMWAIVLGSVDEVTVAIDRGGDLSARNYWEMTPWLLCIQTGSVVKADLLLHKGVNVDDRGRCGQTNLMYAVACDHAEMTRWLLIHGANVHATDDFGHTPLQLAVGSGAATCVQMLLDAGAQLVTPGGENVITEATNDETVRVLLNAGADIDTVGDDGYWLLRTAAEAGDDRFVRTLLELGASPNTTSTGETALHTAVAWDHLQIVSLLLKQGANPNTADVDGWTPLMFARSLECVELLLGAGADVDAHDDVGADVIQHHRDPEILDRLQTAGATVCPKQGSLGTLLHSAAEDGDVDLLDYLLGHRIEVNVATSWGLTPLMTAAEHGRTDVMRRLLEAGADVNARDEHGRTALFYAAAPEAFTAFQLMQEYSGQESRSILVEALGELAGQMQDILDKVTPSPNYGYHASDDVAALDLLVAADANAEERDADGATPLLVACRCGRPARVARLIQLGVAVNVRDAAGRGVRDLTSQHHDPEQRHQILRLLEESS